MYFIIKSGKLNWSGKEFSDFAAKIYTSFESASEAIQNYLLIDMTGNEVQISKSITFKPLNDKQCTKLVTQGKARW